MNHSQNYTATKQKDINRNDKPFLFWASRHAKRHK